jgi:hypothetical protein
MMIARSVELAELLEERLFERDIARARRGEPPSGNRERLEAGCGPSSRFSSKRVSSGWGDVVEPPDHDDSLVVAASG